MCASSSTLRHAVTTNPWFKLIHLLNGAIVCDVDWPLRVVRGFCRSFVVCYIKFQQRSSLWMITMSHVDHNFQLSSEFHTFSWVRTTGCITETVLRMCCPIGRWSQHYFVSTVYVHACKCAGFAGDQRLHTVVARHICNCTKCCIQCIEHRLYMTL